MNVLDLVDTRQGTNNQWSLSKGNTLPYTTTPFGMNAYVMQSRMDDVRYFNANDHATHGIRLTHQPSPWMGDYAFILFNVMSMDEEEFQQFELKEHHHDLLGALNTSSYQPKYATFKPHFLQFERLRDKTEINLIPSKRGAAIKGVFKGAKKRKIFSISIGEEGHLSIEKNGREIKGYTNQLSGSKYGNFGMYFSFTFNGTQVKLLENLAYTEADHKMRMYWFEIVEDVKEVSIDLSTSFISQEQAILNHKQDAFFSLSWEEKKNHAAQVWLDYLNTIDVSHDDADLMKTFYTSLYRTATFPQKAYEYDEKGERVHYSPYTGEVEPGYYFINNGYWDTFRTNYPLYALIIPDQISRFIEGILNIAREDQFLPKWLSPDERGLMPGTLVDAVIADAVVKGLVDDDIVEELLDAMIFTATTESDNELEGREDTENYIKEGFVSTDVRESVNKTLDFSYSDFCIAQVADYLGKTDIAERFYAASLNYRKLFDRSKNQMVPVNKDGEKVLDFNAHRWGTHYTEGSAWQNSLSVFHNIADLIELYGGDEAFYAHLMELVNMDPIYEIGGYGMEIHEMSEMAILQFGQLAISNQPSFHIPYLFTYAGYPHMTHLLVKQLLTNLFSHTPDGFPGDEDNGSMSAWFVLSSLGLYSMTPGTNQYVLGINIWDDAAIHLQNGNVIRFESDPQEPYLNVVTGRIVDQEAYEKDYIEYETLMNGATIAQTLGVIPSVTKTEKEQRPFSLNDK